MSRWFRHYAGMARDDKLVSVAIKSRQSIERVVWVWAAILESAAEIDDDGRYQLDTAEVAYFLRADEADICAVEAGLTASGRVANGSVVKWGNRQFRSDRSAERVAAHRERKRSGGDQSQHRETSRNDGVTLQKRHCNSPELETELETEDPVAKATVRRHADWPDDFCEQLWDIFPKHVEKKAGMEALKAIHRADRVSWLEIVNGVECLFGCDPQFIPALHRWLKGERWKDERPAARPPPPRQARSNSLLEGLAELEQRLAPNVQHFPRIAG